MSRTSVFALGTAAAVSLAVSSTLAVVGRTSGSGPSNDPPTSSTPATSGAPAATVSISVVWGDPPTDRAIRQVRLTFDPGATGTPTLSFAGGAGDPFPCTPIDPVTHVSVCDPVGADRVGVTGLTITVT